MLLEDFLSEMMLYRGDSQHIELFDIEATDYGALFGPGLYLTSDADVAHDYTAARSAERVFPNNRNHVESFNTKDLIRNYVMKFVNEFDEDKFKKEWLKKNHPEIVHGSFYSLPYDVSSHMDAEMRNAMDAAKRKSQQERMHEAIEKVKKELPTLRVQKQTTGEMVLVRKDRKSAVSAFNIPDEYVARTLNADLPLSDKDLVIVKKLWLDTYPNDNGDLRDNNNERIPSFDKFVQHYKARGTRRSWADNGDPMIGGKGQNPSFDDFRNGTHGGHFAFADGREHPNAVIRAFTAAGYVGIEYHGGNRVGGYVRGGGGRKHRAFCFWDVPTVMKFRVENNPLPKLKGLNARSLKIEQTIKEGISDNFLFHYTKSYVLPEILEQNQLGKGSNDPILSYRRGKPSRVSLTRNLNHPWSKSSEVLLVIDSEKLKNRFKIDKTFGDGRKYGHERESEERTRIPISPLSSYLKEIVIDQGLKDDENWEIIKKLLEAYSMKYPNVNVMVANFGDPNWFRKRKLLNFSDESSYGN